MDSLLRYLLYDIAYGLLKLEIVLMLSCCFAIVIVKFISKGVAKRRERIQNHISEIIEEELFADHPIDRIIIPENESQFRNIVETLERYDQRFSDQRWIDIKNSIISYYLHPQVEKYAASYFWDKRQLAARAQLLAPQLASEKILKQLLDDSRYLVRVAAAVCIADTKYKQLFIEMLHKMSHETLLSQFPYRDALIQIDSEKIGWLEELLRENKNKAISAICLDILSTRYSPHLLSLIKPFTNDTDRYCRILATKAIGNIPLEESVNLLMDRLVDSDWEIRSEAILGLQKLYAIQAIPEIKRLLNDTVWWVRLQAAMTLKAFGNKGIDVLNEQKKDKPLAYEIAQYTLALP